ncbi:unnamed protein product [Darwinula stevensoni]|uniref:non-specific protein-tyrosine kinase n=1 Tax=Darwinula stevensoni TaxID=69355 RepID=A0A7R8XBY1_9CRUS|nr:unnamed protein product [Darwinula stevensoni]CAG0892826.1 unnamed protein product [Darwinula stevensoni]
MKDDMPAWKPVALAKKQLNFDSDDDMDHHSDGENTENQSDEGRASSLSIPRSSYGESFSPDSAFETSTEKGISDSPPYRRVKALHLFDVPQTPRSLLESCATSLSPGPLEKSPISRRLFQSNLENISEHTGPSTIPRLPHRNERPVANINPFSPYPALNVEGLASSKKRPWSVLEPEEGSTASPAVNLRGPKRLSLKDFHQSTKQLSLKESNIFRYHQEFLELEKIGTGEFGHVFKCLNRLDGCLYALKKSQKPVTGSSNERSALNEVYAHAVLGKHPHIVRYYSAWAENGHMIIQNEYCSGGSLAELIVKHREEKKPFTESELKQILSHVTQGLRYIHSMNLAHLDIKPGNIFLSHERGLDTSVEDFVNNGKEAEEQKVYKIGDLGHVTSITDIPDQVEEGDCRYLPKEILAEDFQYLTKADIFSLGLSIYEAASGSPLPKNGEKWQELRSGLLPYLSQYTKDFNDLLRVMVHPCPDERPSALEYLMEMGLLPLEYTDCLTDSPYFRENLHAHEKELERTSSAIKTLIKNVKDLLNAARNLSRAQRVLAQNLINFKFECIGNSQTDDEIIIANSLREFGRLINAIEEERDRMASSLERAHDQFIRPLEQFRKEHIGGAKADASVEMEQRYFCQASLEYVFLLQEVQERKKFEFVETLLGFMYGWLTFYHQGHEVAKDFKPYMTDLQTRENFNMTQAKAEQLKQRMLERQLDPGGLNKMYARQGYLYLMEKKAFATTWTKHYCQYQKENRVFTMIPYNQTTGKITSTETMVLKSCVRRQSDSIDKRFCFDITAEDKPGVVHTLQALSEDDRKLWLDAMDGKEPTYAHPSKASTPEETNLDEAGFAFVQKCIEILESRGKIGGSGKLEKLNLDDPTEWETKTITSALKTYFRNLPEPLMTFRHHNAFIVAAKQESVWHRVNDVHVLVHKLPKPHFDMLKILIEHLVRVGEKSEKNLMTVSNLGVCFGPTLLRPEEETMAAIMDIKFCNIVVEILIENFQQIFLTSPELVSDWDKDRDREREHVRHSMISMGLNPLQPSRSQPNVHAACQAAITHLPAPSSSPPNQHGHPIARHLSQSNLLNSQQTYATPTTHAVVASYHDGPRLAQIEGKSKAQGLYRSTDDGGGDSSSRRNVPYRSPPAYHHTHHRPFPYQQSSSSSSLFQSQQQPQPQQQPAQSGVLRQQSSPSHPSLYETRNNLPSKPLHQSSLPEGKMMVHYPPAYRSQELRVRTLYACVGENDSELTFEPNVIITNVRQSTEPGWLEGTLNGQRGLIPENYVEYLP